MKKIGHLISSTGILMLAPLFALAQGTASGFATGNVGGTKAATFVENVVSFINSYLIPGVMALAFLAFIWGMFKYFIAGGANDESKEKGKQLMIYATLGFVMIVIIWGLVNFIAGSLGLNDTDAITIPDLPGTTPVTS